MQQERRRLSPWAVCVLNDVAAVTRPIAVETATRVYGPNVTMQKQLWRETEELLAEKLGKDWDKLPAQ
jgi:hypothetical protein